MNVQKSVSYVGRILQKARYTEKAPDEHFEIVSPPVDPVTLLDLSESNAFHAACIKIKSGVSVGLGFDASNEVSAFLERACVEEPPLIFFHKVATDLETFGNAFIEVSWNRSGKVVELYHVRPLDLNIIRPEGKPHHLYYQPASDRTFFPFHPDNPQSGYSSILHIKFYTPRSYYWGLPEWYTALESLRLDQSIKRFHTSFFSNSTIPPLAVVLEGGEFTDAVAQALKDALRANAGPENAHRVLVLDIPFEEASLKFHKLSSEQKDMSFESLYRASREEIIAAHQVPPRLLGLVTPGQLGGGSEAREQLRIFHDITIRRRQRLLEHAFSRVFAAAGISGTFTFRSFLEEPDLVETLKRIEKQL